MMHLAGWNPPWILPAAGSMRRPHELPPRLNVNLPAEICIDAAVAAYCTRPRDTQKPDCLQKKTISERVLGSPKG